MLDPPAVLPPYRNPQAPRPPRPVLPEGSRLTARGYDYRLRSQRERDEG